jgi:hypothetical protein
MLSRSEEEAHGAHTAHHATSCHRQLQTSTNKHKHKPPPVASRKSKSADRGGDRVPGACSLCSCSLCSFSSCPYKPRPAPAPNPRQPGRQRPACTLHLPAGIRHSPTGACPARRRCRAALLAGPRTRAPHSIHTSARSRRSCTRLAMHLHACVCMHMCRRPARHASL